MKPSIIEIEVVTKKLFQSFFSQCGYPSSIDLNIGVLPFERTLFLHSIQEDNHYKIPCCLVKYIKFGTSEFVHPKDIQALVNMSNYSHWSRKFIGFLRYWFTYGRFSTTAQGFGKPNLNLYTGPGYIFDGTGKLLMLTTVDVYTRSSTRQRKYADHADENGETVWVTENVLEKTFYVKNPTLFIHPDIFKEKKLKMLKEWVQLYVISACQNMIPIDNRFLGSQAKRKMKHNINIVFKPMDQFVSKPKEPSVTEDFSGEMNSLMLSKLDTLHHIAT